MNIGHGEVIEIYLDENSPARINCPQNLIPAPGQYLLAANADDSSAPLPVPLFASALHADGFTASAPFPKTWMTPGTKLNLRGPLGKGFEIPKAARRVALIAFENSSPAPLLALIHTLSTQNASIVLICSTPPNHLPADLEIAPPSQIKEILNWADAVAINVTTSSLESALSHLKLFSGYAQFLIQTPIACGGLADCGVCAVKIINDYKLLCKDGPVVEVG